MNQELWAKVYNEHYPTLVRSMKNLLHGNPSDAEDIVQSVFVKLMATYPDNIDVINNIGGFLQRSALNRSRDQLKHTIRTISPIGESKELSELHLASAHDVEAEVFRTIQLQTLAAAIRRLPPDSQEVMNLLAQGYAYKEIAQTMKVPEGTISARISRAKEQMLKENKLFK